MQVTRRQALTFLASSAAAIGAAAPTLARTAPAHVDTAVERELRAWPNRPIKLLIGFPPGSVQDLSARVIAPGLSNTFGVPVVVENKSGAGGVIAGDMVSRAKDFYTFGVMNNSQMTVAKLLNPSAPYDPPKDLTPIAQIAVTPLLLVVNGHAEGSTPRDLLMWLNNQRERANYGSPGLGTPGHLGFELLKVRSGLETVHIPYKGNPDVINAMIAGQIQAGLMPPGLVLPHIKAGRLHAIAVTSEKRSVLAPQFPTLRELNIPGADLELWTALAGPKDMPQPLVEKLSAATVALARDPAITKALLNVGWQSKPVEWTAMHHRTEADTASLGGIILMRGIHTSA